MKIQRLDLRTFGPFSDLVLDFETEANFHIIYGPNEAGKSSALRALNALFFGIPNQTGDDFLHSYKKLRLGAVLEHSDGKTLEFWRRKANLNSLFAADDKTPLEPGALQKYLGSVDQSLFTTMFGLDREGLAQGGQEIMRGAGRLGQLLFAAGAGIADLKAVQDTLETEWQELYTPAGKIKKVNRGLTELRDSREQVKSRQLTLEEWSSHDQSLRDAQERRDHLQARLEQVRAKESKLSRLRDSLPVLLRRQEILKAVGEAGDAPLLADDFPDRRRRVERELHLSQQQQDDLKHTLETIDDELGRIEVPHEFLEHQDSLEKLQRRLGEYLRHERERPDREQAQQRCRTALVDLERKLGLNDIAHHHAAPYENPEEILGLRHLSAQYPRLHANLDHARQAVARLEQQHAALLSESERIDAVPDFGELKLIVRRIGPALAHESELARLRKQLAELELSNRAASAHLFGGLAHTDRADIELPAADVLDRFQSNWDKNQQRQQTLEQQSKLNEQDLREVELQLSDISLGPDLPTGSDLIEARKKRDETWRLIRTTWLERVKGSHTPAELVERYEQQSKQVDLLADRLWREAERVGRKTELLAQKDRFEQHGQYLIHQLVEVRARHEQMQMEWQKIWQPLGIEPREPSAMRTWLEKHRTLSRDLGRAEEIGRRIAELEEEVAAARLELLAALSKHEINHADESLTLLTERAQDILDALESKHHRHGETQRLRQANEQDLEQAHHRLTQAQEDMLTWQAQWRPHVEMLGLHGDATPADAQARLDLWSQWSARRKEASDLDRWLENVDHELHTFAEETRGWVAKLLPTDGPAQDLEVLHAVETLTLQLRDARAGRERATTLKKQRDDAQRKLNTAIESGRRAEAAHLALCKEAGTETPHHLPALEQSAFELRDLQRELARIEHQFSPGNDHEHLDAPRLDNEIESLVFEIGSLGKQIRELDQHIGSERAELSRMNGGADAADAAQRSEWLASQVTHDLEQYLVLRLAGGILQESIESYRQKNEGTVIQRAGRLFQRLTVGSFDGLEIDSDDNGELVLFGVRADDRTPIGVEAMSDGARDQLYLALRLASLETYLDRHEPMPLIVDDLLLHFDNDRAVAALKSIADLSHRTQVLFFTHHKHLIDLATKHLPSERVLMHRLQGRGTSREAMAELF